MPMIGNEPAWRVILREGGYPTDVVLIDFETFFDQDYSMSKLSTVEYILDPRYEEIGKSIIHVKQPFEPVVVNFYRGDDDSYIRYLTREYGDNLEGCTLVAQNAPFDGTILVRKYGICPQFCVDTLALLRHEDSRRRNDLATASERENLPAKGDTSQFAGVHLQGITDEQWMAMSAYANRDAKNEWHIFTRKMSRLSRPAVELRLIQHTLELFWKPTLRINQQSATDLIAKMEAKIDEAVAPTGVDRESISKNKEFGILLGKALDEAGDTIEKYQKHGKPTPTGKPRVLLAIAKDDDKLVVLKAHQSPKVRELMAARQAVKSWPLHIGRVHSIMAQARATDGLLAVPLRYHGAHTGRWAGDEALNLQNLPSRSNELANAIRNIIEAPDGQVLIIDDLSAIEARGTAWIAGQEDMLTLFREGREIYCEYAAVMAGRPLRKARKTDPPWLKKYYERMRNMGKVQVLGCGYGMGAIKCVDFASSTYGVELTLKEATDLVQSYRKKVPKITQFWRDIERHFKFTARYHEPQQMARGLKFHWEEEGDVTVITLPSGRTLKYPKVRVSIIDMKEQLWMPDPRKGPGSRLFLWGGVLTENVVQAFCRDILAEGFLRIEASGIHVALHVHDEVVALVDESEGKVALEKINAMMTVPPEWAPDFPLAAEGKVSKRYEK